MASGSAKMLCEGYTKTFGIVHIDPQTQDRTPKASYHWLAETIRARG